jgi:hypothetical protein
MSSNKILPPVYIDPPSITYYEDRLFDIKNTILNRDDSLLPYYQIREAFQALGSSVHTADVLPSEKIIGGCDYYSLGVLKNYKKLTERQDVRLRAFVIFEPPVVQPELYAALPYLTEHFEKVYIHNINGDGYSLRNVDTYKLTKLYWPQPRLKVIDPYWNNSDRVKKIVVINGNHIPTNFTNELYSKRIEVMAALASTGKIDLYGRGWGKWWSRASMWMPYWTNRRSLMSIYRGECKSKYATLSKYCFSLCFENMKMQGYITEKIFDCFYAGTIPIYLGAPDVSELIPKTAYIDCRQFHNWDLLLQYIENLSDYEIDFYKKSGRDFIQNNLNHKYSKSLWSIFNLNYE